MNIIGFRRHRKVIHFHFRRIIIYCGYTIWEKYLVLFFSLFSGTIYLFFHRLFGTLFDTAVYTSLFLSVGYVFRLRYRLKAEKIFQYSFTRFLNHEIAKFFILNLMITSVIATFHFFQIVRFFSHIEFLLIFVSIQIGLTVFLISSVLLRCYFSKVTKKPRLNI